MYGKRSTWLTAALGSLSLLFLPQASFGWFTVPPPAGVQVLLDTQDAQLSSYANPSNQSEWLLNNGGGSSMRIKGTENPSLLKFDLSAYRGQQVLAAELHLARSNTDAVSALVASTVNTDWSEGTVCYRYRALPGTEWAYSHSDATCATFGNFGTFVSFGCSAGNTFRTYSYNGYTWIALVIDPSLVQAMILDQPGGLAITDSRFHSGGNPTVYTKDQNATVQPRLFVQFAPSTDTTPPTAVGSLAAAPGMDNGTVELSFTAPSDVDDAKAFGYTVRYSTAGDFSTATDVARWRIPRPKAPGASQKMLIEGLTAGTSYNFFIQAYDAVGNAGAVAGVSYTLPAAVSTPVLANGGLATPSATGKTVQTVAGILRYFAASETARINPVTGNRYEDGYTGTGADDYKKANVVWDAASNTISLLGCRNEMVGSQMILQRLGSALSNVSVTVSDLSGPSGAIIPASPNVELFQIHYVASGTRKYSEAAIPLSAPLPTTFSIPDANHNAGGTYQSVWMDLYVPQAARAGNYTGTITVTATELASPVTINLKVRVSRVSIPDYPSFIVDLNGYGNPWDFGPSYSNTCLKYFQVVHKNRAVPNTLPYGWSGNAQADRGPSLAGNGPTTHANSWATFDAKYGRFFSSDPAASAFNGASGYTGPGVNTPITHFYTTFNESWPQSILDTTYGFDAAGLGPTHWSDLQIAGVASGNWSTMFATLPDSWTAFPDGYKQANINVISDWFQHAHAKGWTKTAFEIYLNEKYYYNGAHVFWAMEENEAADDFRVDGFLHQVWRDGQAASGVTDVPWHFRIDISDRYGQNWGQLDSRINWWDLGSGAAGWHWPQKKYRQYFLDADKPEDWIWYGGGANLGTNGMGNAQLFLSRWSQGYNGGLPYWNCYQMGTDGIGAWSTVNDGDPCLVYSGAAVPGFGLYSGPIISQRVKQMRQAEQVIELLNKWAGMSGLNRDLVRDALTAKYGDKTWDYAFAGLNELNLYKLRADLVAQIETSGYLAGDINGDGIVDVIDLLGFADAWGTVSTDAAYNPLCDFNQDNSIDTLDLLALAANWGSSAPVP